jgi:ketosteroid isomerase-like protein
MRTPLPPVAVVISFIDRINHGDISGLGALMTDDHRLQFPEDPPVLGREANVEAWVGYAAAYPDYVIYPTQIADLGDRVAVLGSTTGSHLDLPDDEELQQPVVWVASVRDGLVGVWEILDDAPDVRRRLGLRTDMPPPDRPAGL